MNEHSHLPTGLSTRAFIRLLVAGFEDSGGLVECANYTNAKEFLLNGLTGAIVAIDDLDLGDRFRETASARNAFRAALALVDRGLRARVAGRRRSRGKVRKSC